MFAVRDSRIEKIMSHKFTPDYDKGADHGRNLTGLVKMKEGIDFEIRLGEFRFK